MKESRKVYGCMVCGEDAAAGRSSMWAGTMGGECDCGNSLWQLCRTVCPSANLNFYNIARAATEKLKVKSKQEIDA